MSDAYSRKRCIDFMHEGCFFQGFPFQEGLAWSWECCQQTTFSGHPQGLPQLQTPVLPGADYTQGGWKPWCRVPAISSQHRTALMQAHGFLWDWLRLLDLHLRFFFFFLNPSQLLSSPIHLPISILHFNLSESACYKT